MLADVRMIQRMCSVSVKRSQKNLSQTQFRLVFGVFDILRDTQNVLIKLHLPEFASHVAMRVNKTIADSQQN